LYGLVLLNCFKIWSRQLIQIKYELFEEIIELIVDKGLFTGGTWFGFIGEDS